jgi:hypothetical protein
LWWYAELEEPLPLCQLDLRVRYSWQGKDKTKSGQAVPPSVDAATQAMWDRQPLNVSILSAAGRVIWSTLVSPPATSASGQLLASMTRPTDAAGVALPPRVWTTKVQLPSPVLGKFVRIEKPIDETLFADVSLPPPVLALGVDVFADEQLSWPRADVHGHTKVCRLMQWRGACPGAYAKVMLPLVGSWSGFVRCVADSSMFRYGLFKALNYQPFMANHHKGGGIDDGTVASVLANESMRESKTIGRDDHHSHSYEERDFSGSGGSMANSRAFLLDGRGRRLADSSAAGASRRSVTSHGERQVQLDPVYLSTDSPALQALALEAFPKSVVTIEGEPVPSWERNRTMSEYAKVLADFEMLKLCDVVVGPVSSRYAQTAVVESLVSRGYFNQHGMCAYDKAASLRLGRHTPSLAMFEKSRSVSGMFDECVALP